MNEIEVERLVLRDPNGGRVRAVLETGAPRQPATGAPVPAVRLSLLGPDGKAALVLEVGDDGEPWVFVGDPDAGTTIAISRRALDAWAGGCIVSSVRSTDDGGRLELAGADGRAVIALP